LKGATDRVRVEESLKTGKYWLQVKEITVILHNLSNLTITQNRPVFLDADVKTPRVLVSYALRDFYQLNNHLSLHYNGEYCYMPDYVQ
jgi:hypothetical protein